jgi:hypothetical protein
MVVVMHIFHLVWRIMRVTWLAGVVCSPALCVHLQYVGEDDPLSLITQFVTGYGKKGQLSNTEIDILPDLINLRIFSNVIYFTGRCVDATEVAMYLNIWTSRACGTNGSVQLQPLKAAQPLQHSRQHSRQHSMPVKPQSRQYLHWGDGLGSYPLHMVDLAAGKRAHFCSWHAAAAASFFAGFPLQGTRW